MTSYPLALNTDAGDPIDPPLCSAPDSEDPRVLAATPVRSEGALTPREHVVMALLTDGLTRQETAARLGLAFHTVNTHTQNIYRKTGATNRVELTRWRLANELTATRELLVKAIEFIDAAGLFPEASA